VGARQIRILLVDDAAVVAASLEGRGHAVRRVSSDSDVARALRDATDPIDLVILDAGAGHEGAAVATAALVRATRSVAVVFIVSQPPGDDLLLAASGVIQKDASAPILDASIAMALRLFEAERELAHQRQDLEGIGAQAKLGSWQFDPSIARLVCSPAVCQVLDVPASPPLDLASFSELYGLGTWGSLVQAIERALADDKPFSLVSEIVTASGARKWVRAQGKADDRSGTGRCVLGTLQDISEIRLLDRVTQESDLTLSQVERITHIGHWSVSLADGALYHSDEIKRIFGYEPSEYALSVEQAINAYHPDDRDAVNRLFNRAVETGQGYEFDLRIVQPSGAVRYVHSKGYTERDASGKVTRLYGVLQDVTDRERAGRALRESEASMKALVDGVQTAIVVYGKEGEILLSNQMAKRLLQPLTTEPFGKDPPHSAWRFIREGGEPISVEELPASEILRTGQRVENVVVGRRDADATTWWLVNGTPVADDNGTIAKAIVSFVDITARKDMEERLHQSDKLNAIGQLAGGVAHDFNNQLTVILSYAELAKRKLDASSPAVAFMNGIISAVHHSANLTRQLLAFARKGNYVVTTVNLDATIADVVSIALHSFDKKIAIEHTTSERPAMVAGDVSQLQNAILNIALNARDAMPAGGALQFATQVVTLDERSPRAAELNVAHGEYVKVSIRDTGVGMDAATQKRIFEPFFTTKAPGHGSGMGMASVYGTTKTHHGALLVESAPGAGTTISMYLPLAMGRSEQTVGAAPSLAARTARLLLVDDEEPVAASLGMLLNSHGYLTTSCRGGQEALRHFEQSWRATDLVLLDVIMPDMDGVEVFHAMKQIDPAVRVILLSGYTPSAEAKRLAEEGAVGFLLKPVIVDDLLKAIAAALSLGADPR